MDLPLGPETMIIQPEFEELVRAADENCMTRFGKRLAAVYLAGSIAVGEAWPGASDLDWWVFLRDRPAARLNDIVGWRMYEGYPEFMDTSHAYIHCPEYR